MGIFGEFKVLSGRVTYESFTKASLTVELADRRLTMPLSASKQEYVNEGSEMDFVVRTNLLFRNHLTGRAFRQKGNPTIHAGRTSHYWLGIFLSCAVAWFWISDSLHSGHFDIPMPDSENWWEWAILISGAYSAVAIAETREAVRTLSAPRGSAAPPSSPG